MTFSQGRFESLLPLRLQWLTGSKVLMYKHVIERAQTHEDKSLAKISVAIKGLCQKQSHETATKGHHYFSAKISEKGKIEQNSSFNI